MNAIASSIREGGTNTNALMNLSTYLVFNFSGSGRKKAK
jgi:hypothetical protein